MEYYESTTCVVQCREGTNKCVISAQGFFYEMMFYGEPPFRTVSFEYNISMLVSKYTTGIYRMHIYVDCS